MSSSYPYVCPTCGTANILHDIGCKYEHTDLSEFEKPYIDLLSVLTAHAAQNEVYMAKPVISKKVLVRKVEQLHDHNPWLEKHNDCLQRLIDERRVIWEHGGLRLIKPGEQTERLIPGFEPLRTIYEYGPVDGAKDYAVFTMVSWCTLKEMTWEQTKNFCTEWLEETGSWERESWAEGSISELLREKHHVWKHDLGWGDMANAAKNEIDNSGVEKGIDIRDKYGAKYEDYE